MFVSSLRAARGTGCQPTEARLAEAALPPQTGPGAVLALWSLGPPTPPPALQLVGSGN